MNLIFLLIFNSLIILPLTNGIYEDYKCCKNTTSVMDEMKCESGENVNILCSGRRKLETIDEGNLQNYVILKDDRGQYLLVKENKFTIRPPHFCFGIQIKSPTDGDDEYSYDVLITCLTESENRLNMFEIITSICNIVSSVVLLVTAFIYFVIPQTQDVEGQCTFHLTLMLSLFHLRFAYKVLVADFEIFLIPHLCITKLFLLKFVILSSFTWSSVLSYHMWSRFRKNGIFNESKLMFRYRLVGYGIPALLILLANIHVYVDAFFSGSSFVPKCSTHEIIMTVLYTILPIGVMELVNGFFFIDLQRRLWNVYPPNSREQSMPLYKKVQYKLIMNVKLFVIMGLPWLLMVFLSWLCISLNGQLLESLCLKIESFLFIMICCQGIFIFLIMVVGRKRVRQGLVDKFGITRCKPSSLEASIESNIEEKNEDVQELQINTSTPISNHD